MSGGDLCDLELLDLPSMASVRPEKSQWDEQTRMETGGDDGQHTLPAVADQASHPTLESPNASTHTISRTLSQQTATQENVNRLGKSEGEPYKTEGIRNPGWLAVISAFLVNFIIFGTLWSWGNFQYMYINQIYVGQTDEFRIAFVGTSANATILSCGLFLTPVIGRIGYRSTMVIGALVAALGLILASFSTALWQLYLTQGVLFGIGGAFAFYASITLPSQWFVRNRALATGIAVGGSGIGGVCLSPLSQHLIATIGYRNALRVLGSMVFAVICVATTMATSRFKAENRGKWWNVIDRSLINFPFLLLLLFELLVPFGYVGPFFLTPSFAADRLHASAASGSTLVSVMSAMNAICRIVLGFAGDRWGRFNTMYMCTLLSGLVTVLVWQFADSYGVYVAYCILFGLTGGGFVSLTPPVTAEIVGIDNIQKGVGMVYLCTMFGNLLGTPIAGKLKDTFGWTAAIQFSGAMTLAGGLVALVLRLMKSRNLFEKA